MAPGLDDFDVSGFDLESTAADCLSDVGLAEVKAMADGAHREIYNAWDAMLQWYEVSLLPH